MLCIHNNLFPILLLWFLTKHQPHPQNSSLKPDISFLKNIHILDIISWDYRAILECCALKEKKQFSSRAVSSGFWSLVILPWSEVTRFWSYGWGLEDIAKKVGMTVLKGPSVGTDFHQTTSFSGNKRLQHFPSPEAPLSANPNHVYFLLRLYKAFRCTLCHKIPSLHLMFGPFSYVSAAITAQTRPLTFGCPPPHPSPSPTALSLYILSTHIQYFNHFHPKSLVGNVSYMEIVLAAKF